MENIKLGGAMINKSIGVISDTHNLLRKEVIENLYDMDLIIHAGDIGDYSIINKLKEITDVIYVKGNIDNGKWADNVPIYQSIDFYGLRIYIIHNISDLKIDPVNESIDIVISGHSHKAKQYKEKEVIYLNPGSVGAKRFNLPVSYAVININNDDINIEIKYV
jgi:putative phosphoesterase